MSDTVALETNHNGEELNHQPQVDQLLLPGSGRFEVEWDTAAKVTPRGGLVFFAQYLETGGLLERLCQDSPLGYQSPNAPQERDVLGTIILSVLNGQSRYAHISALRGDRVSAQMLGLTKVVSKDSVRRALKRGSAEAWDTWLGAQERAVYEPLLSEGYVLDIDSTVKPLYGHQEGAEVGYNPKKPGRPSHNYHTYFIGALRLVMGVEVLPGKKHAGRHSLRGLWKLIDRLPSACRPKLIRGDVSYGHEQGMLEAETRGQTYLFRLRQTRKVKGQIRRLETDAHAWSDAGFGWQGAQSQLKLMGWSRARRCLFLRRPVAPQPKNPALAETSAKEFDFVAQLPGGDRSSYEYLVLVTNDTQPLALLAQLYRDRADCENVFDEIKNQWGWAGFVTRDLERCARMARLIALVYNWWNIFTRLAAPREHLEAITSRPLLLEAVGRLVLTGRRKILRLTSTHAKADQIQRALKGIARFLDRLGETAAQLGRDATWALLLSVAFVKWLRGKVLDPVADGPQLVLQLLG